MRSLGLVSVTESLIPHDLKIKMEWFIGFGIAGVSGGIYPFAFAAQSLVLGAYWRVCVSYRDS